jgi:serine/threonine-protein kinase
MTDTPWTPTRLQQARALFEAVLDSNPADVAAFLQQAAPDDRTLHADVQSLLAAHALSEDTLGTSAASGATRDDALTAADPWQGRRVGVYDVRALIGIGGMGSVYEAVRDDDQFHKRVAIKFLRRSAESDLAIRRFRYERQILANLSHPNIAALLDGGVAPDGQPFFAMEFVDGMPLTAWCAARRLGLRERLVLFLQVCAAVQHAHQNLVVHRDLKPGNILVTDDGTVKLLDFGIAKLLREEEGPDQLPPTIGATRAFTPEYAAPEQVRGLPVGTAVDVYALGVVLFELLTGRRPFQLRGRLLDEIERIVCTEEPPKPSSAVTPEQVDQLGARSLARVRGRLEGDLDAIVLTALRKQPERRYGSVEQLARDIRAHLDGLPVTARPDGVGYRVVKFLRRRRLEVAASTLVAASLVVGIVMTTRQARVAERERERATAVTDFVTGMLAAPDPGELGRDVTMREVLDSAAVRADSLDSQPELAAEVRTVIGETYRSLGLYDAAIEQFRRAYDYRRRIAPRGDLATGVLLTQLSGAYEFLGDYPTADSVLQVADTLVQQYADADDPARGSILDSQGRLREQVGDLEAAERFHRAALAFRQRVQPDNDELLAFSLNNLGTILTQRGEFAVAESLHAEAVLASRRAFGAEHPLVASTLGQWAYVLELNGDIARSDSVSELVLAMRRRLLGPEHPDYAWTLFQSAQFLVRTERYERAVARAREVLALRGRTLTDEHPAVSTAMQALGLALSHLGSFPEAERHLRESVALRRATLPEGHWLIASGEGVLGEHLTRAGRYADAERLLLGSEAQLSAERDARTPQVQDARKRLVRLYTEWNRPSDAARWQALLDENAEQTGG